jgi:hypothetical protein
LDTWATDGDQRAGANQESRPVNGACLSKNRPLDSQVLSDKPLPFVDIRILPNLRPAFSVGERLARLFIRDIGAFHDLVNFKRLLVERT